MESQFAQGTIVELKKRKSGVDKWKSEELVKGQGSLARIDPCT